MCCNGSFERKNHFQNILNKLNLQKSDFHLFFYLWFAEWPRLVLCLEKSFTCMHAPRALEPCVQETAHFTIHDKHYGNR